MERMIVNDVIKISTDSSGIGVGLFSTCIDVKFVVIAMVPDWYVPYIVIWSANSLSSVSWCGCPYGLSIPALIMAIEGETSVKKASVVAVLLP